VTPTKRYMTYCEPCGFKRILETNKPEDMITIQTSAIPGGVPQLDPTTNKTILKESKPGPIKVKCPKCGRGVVLKELPEVYAKQYTAIDERKAKERRAADKQQRIQDGKPIKREKDPDFLG
jgi:DNA-directed RNA polymerase subunit RPC12/RpoP